MAEIARFYGIVISMYYKPKEHEPCHIHATYGEYAGIVDISSMEMLEGDLPRKALDLIKEWMAMYRAELLDMWSNQSVYKLPLL